MHDFKVALAELEAQHLLRKRRVVSSPSSPRMQVADRSVLSFCNNDYLGLANDLRIAAAARDAMDSFGIGASASALISGHSAAHASLEYALARFVGMPGALTFTNGYMANIGVITALIGPGDTVFCDRLNHASLIDGIRLSRAELKVYPHVDTDRLAHLLAKCTSKRKLIVTDAVFSMDGDIAPLPTLLALCERYDAWLMVDDAHGFGVLGPQGRGSLAHFKTDSTTHSERVIYMATLGKAVGVAGAFVAANEDIIAWLIQRARTYMFTTANPALLAHAASAALTLIEEEEWRRDHLKMLGEALRHALKGLPWTLAPSQTAIHPLIIGDNQTTHMLARLLWNQSIWVPAICPPTVPKGTARLRISLGALHTMADIAHIAESLHAAAATLTKEPG
ncbi:8-amino-7-oxononanoate synthase [Robbsia andropogonis]|uniref:8-amino-7-oxononanoate synthase n=1 Tax=Robbsia andropogonis TaxID=28092 RepID=UPI0020A0F3CC|nr:8-amino-7-oxononanoate synthase [Robbsia andropogonis]MCP1118184.1 8-amino-7-oxononanoate synthase [Robbsia andropogonis]MCP1127535.1 8-amino-7-oxononanoate synthase [Robbsia andropogonis]